MCGIVYNCAELCEKFCRIVYNCVELCTIVWNCVMNCAELCRIVRNCVELCEIVWWIVRNCTEFIIVDYIRSMQQNLKYDTWSRQIMISLIKEFDCFFFLLVYFYYKTNLRRTERFRWNLDSVSSSSLWFAMAKNKLLKYYRFFDEKNMKKQSELNLINWSWIYKE